MNQKILAREAMKLSALFLSMLVLFQCKKPEATIGKEIQPGEDQIGVSRDTTIAFSLKTALTDSIKVDELSQSMAGVYVDHETGKFTTSFSAQVRLSSSNVSFGDINNLEIDSVILSLRYSGAYGNSNFPLSLGVYRLDQSIELDSIYHSNKVPSYFPQNIVDPTHTFSEHKIDSFVPVGNDTLDPQLRIPLNKEWWKSEIIDTDSNNFADSESFLNYFKGIYVKTTDEPSVGDGMVLNFNLVNVESEITMYYHNLNDPDSILEYPFLINGNSARINHFEIDASGSEVEQHLMGNLENVSKVYIQSGGALQVEADFSDLNLLLDSGEISINEAKLILPVFPGTDQLFKPHEKLFLSTLNNEGEQVIIADQLEGDQFIGGDYDEEKNQYTFRITRWVQQLLTGRQLSKKIFITAGLSGVSASRTVLQGQTGNTMNDINPKLVLTISKF